VSINVIRSVRFRQPSRRSDCPPARSARRPVVNHAREQGALRPAADRLLVCRRRAYPTTKSISQTCQPANVSLAAAPGRGAANVPASRAPSGFRSVARRRAAGAGHQRAPRDSSSGPCSRLSNGRYRSAEINAARMALILARITSCRSIADCDRLPWQAPGRSTGLLHYPAQHRRPPRRRPILEVLGSRIEGEQLLEQPVGGSQLKSRCAPGLVPR
jgi:hypothetical protein